MGKPIKILHVVGRMQKGGIETLLMNIFRNLDRDMYEFSFLVHTSEKADYDEEIMRLGGNIHHAFHPKENIVKYENNIKKILQETGPYDVVHSHIYTFSGVVLEIARKVGIKVRIAHSHTVDNKMETSYMKRLYKFLMRKKIMSNATHLIGCSNEACTSLFGKNSEQDKRIQIINNAIDLTSFQEAECLLSNNSIRKELNLPDNSFLVGNVGRFVNAKNHMRLLEIFNNVLQINSNSFLILVGEGELVEKVRIRVSELGIENNVFFLGVRNDIPQLMKELDVFVLPSLYEGLGMVLVEAQAAGTKCIASNKVPIHSDIGLNMIDFIDLKKDDEYWANMIIKQKSSIPRWDERKKAIIERGYDIKSIVETLERLYKKNEVS